MQQVNLESVESVLQNICQRSRDAAKIGFVLKEVNLVEDDGSTYITLTCGINLNNCMLREIVIDLLRGEIMQKFKLEVVEVHYSYC